MYCFNLLLYYWRFGIFSLLVLNFFQKCVLHYFFGHHFSNHNYQAAKLGNLRACTKLGSLCILHKVFCLMLVCELDRGQVEIHLNTTLSLHLSLVGGYLLRLWLKPLPCACSCLQGIEQERLLDFKWAAGGRRTEVLGALLWQKWLWVYLDLSSVKSNQKSLDHLLQWICLIWQRNRGKSYGMEAYGMRG